MNEPLKTSLGIWAFGPMVTRFVPGGYKPELAGQTTVERVRHAVEGLRDLIDGYEFHYPQELSRDNLDEVRGALDGPANAVDGRLVRELGLVAGRDEPRRH